MPGSVLTSVREMSAQLLTCMLRVLEHNSPHPMLELEL